MASKIKWVFSVAASAVVGAVAIRGFDRLMEARKQRKAEADAEAEGGAGGKSEAVAGAPAASTLQPAVPVAPYTPLGAPQMLVPALPMLVPGQVAPPPWGVPPQAVPADNGAHYQPNAGAPADEEAEGAAELEAWLQEDVS